MTKGVKFNDGITFSQATSKRGQTLNQTCSIKASKTSDTNIKKQ